MAKGADGRVSALQQQVDRAIAAQLRSAGLPVTPEGLELLPEWRRNAIVACVPTSLLAVVARRKPALRLALAWSGRCDEETQVFLLHWGDSETRWHILWHRDGVSRAVLARAARAEDPEVRAAVAHCLRAGAALVAELAKDPDPVVRREIVGREDTLPPALLIELTADSDADVRRRAIERLPTADSDAPAIEGALAARTDDPDVEVRHAAAQHPRMPAGALARMAADPCARVRFAVGRHAAADELTLERLMTDVDADVRVAAVQHERFPPARLAAAASDPSLHVRAACAAHPRVATQVLARLAADPEPDVRDAVAIRDDLHASVVAVLRASGDAPRLR
ncbi:MAG: hypothetical protein IT373_13945 [Polyangiaceae bacterium]|nr:hypothetical protein [Polyangiaceae bacterium]